ncbi:MAG: hypothetical protein BWY11_00543 [Firmicutes bacterium ADurb.Bin182]|nr:MAG: hypothetical protein BWY11_00543 [Firmicutes bacterium ADurb.Bin182]
MKIKLIDRILLALILIAVLLICAALIGIALRLIPMALLQSMVEWPFLNVVNSAVLGSAGALFFILAFRLFFAGKKQPEQKPAFSLVKNNEFGSVYITLSAIDSMIQKHCRSNTRIRDCQSAVNLTDDGIRINLKLSLLPDSNVPELTAELQKGLKEYVESLSGIMVQDIGILVESMSSLPKSRAD